MDNFTGASFCDSGNYSFIDNKNTNNFDSRLPICSHINNMDSLLNVKNDLINYLDNDSFILKDSNNSSTLNHINDFIKRGNLLREELISSEKNYEDYRIKINDNLSKINAFLEFVTKLNDIPSDHYKLLKESINILIEDTSDKDKLEEIKSKYTIAKTNYMIYLNELLHINQTNIGNKCSICLTNIVTSYYNPCGHTICDECDKFRNGENCRCPICRSNVNEKRKLFFI